MRSLWMALLPALLVPLTDCSSLPPGTCTPACSGGYTCSAGVCLPPHVSACYNTGPDATLCQTFCAQAARTCTVGGSLCGEPVCQTLAVCQQTCMGVDTPTAIRYGCIVANVDCTSAGACAQECLAPSDAGAPVDVTAACGVDRRPCCGGAICLSGLSCTGGVCRGPNTPCGVVGGPCCGGSVCAMGATCRLGACHGCGTSGQFCCEGGACDIGFACVGEVCTQAL